MTSNKLEKLLHLVGWSRVFVSNRLSQTKTKRQFKLPVNAMRTNRRSRSPPGLQLLLSGRRHTAAAAVAKQNNVRIEISVVVGCAGCSACIVRDWPEGAGTVIFRNVGHHLPSTSAHSSGHLKTAQRRPACCKQQDDKRCDVTTLQQFVSRFHAFLALTLGKERG